MKPFILKELGLSLDLSGMNAGINTPISAEAIVTWTAMRGRLKAKESGFYNAPIDESLSQVTDSLKSAQLIRARTDLTDVIFIGIGGSSLGPMCLLDSLKHLAESKLRVHFFENPDPIDWQYRTQHLQAKSTFVCVVTKSGTTYETLGLFMLAWDWLVNGLGTTDAAAANTLAITDPKKGELRKFCEQQSIPILHIDPTIGGRYSIFSPVGLWLGAVMGLNMKNFLGGAGAAHQLCETHPPESQWLVHWGESLLAAKKSHIHVMMPYSSSLKLLANWWVQLWAESLGKDGKGFTAVPALGAIDQHSMLQLLRDGPRDKAVWFVTLQDFGKKVAIPSIGFQEGTFGLLQQKSLATLLKIEFDAIERVMKNQKRDSLHLSLDRLDEFHMGAVLYSLCVLTAYVGARMGMNPFDQPGVEEGKVYIRDALQG